MPRFRKKPVVIDAIRWTKDNADDVWVWARNMAAGAEPTDILFVDGAFKVRTINGWVTANVGEWIIRGVEGELYPCDPGIFEKTYEPVE